MLHLNRDQIDSLAAFAEACAEMGQEPFFILQDPVPNFQASSDWMRVTYFMGDRMQFRSGLIPFRRVWSKSEPAHWETTVGILGGANLPPQLNDAAKTEAELIRHELARTKQPHRIALATGRVIDLWLNATVAPTGAGGTSRAEFERCISEFGHTPFEFAFRSGVRTMGYHFQRLSDYAVRPVLELARTRLTLVPSFKVGAAGAIKRRETTPKGATILRRGASDHGHNETFEERYLRLLDRYDNQSLQRIFTRLEASQGELMRAVLWCQSFTELLESVEGRVELTTLSWGDAGRQRTEGSLYGAALSDGVWFYLYERNVLVSDNPVSIGLFHKVSVGFQVLHEIQPYTRGNLR